MNYTASHAYEQLEFDFSAPFYLLIPSALPGFHNTDTKRYNSISGAVVYLMRGSQDILPEDAVCASCGAAMHVHSNREIVLSHLRFGNALTQISVTRKCFLCPSCGASHMQYLPYCSEHHRITKELETYACDLLALGTYTNKQVAELCGLHQHTVKAIDKRRLESLYVKDGKLVKPKHYARFLGIDEFKLRDGRQYATHIMTADLVKEALREAYACKNEADMIGHINTVLDLCRETKNRRFLWFYRLIQTHFEGIVAHGKFHIANGRMEGLNQKIKTMRRHAYGIADDEYLFLKIMDLSRASYVRNPKSHKVLY